MTTIDVQTAISPAVLFRMYEQMSHQDMYGGAMYDLSQGRAAMPYESLTVGGAVMDPAAASGAVSFPIVLDQSATANRTPPLDWYPGQYVASNDDAKAERLKAEYAGFYDQWVKATLSNYK